MPKATPKATLHCVASTVRVRRTLSASANLGPSYGYRGDDDSTRSDKQSIASVDSLSEHTSTSDNLIDLQTPPLQSLNQSFSPSLSQSVSPTIPAEHYPFGIATNEPSSEHSVLVNLIDLDLSPNANGDASADVADILRSTGIGWMNDMNELDRLFDSEADFE